MHYSPLLSGGTWLVATLLASAILPLRAAEYTLTGKLTGLPPIVSSGGAYTLASMQPTSSPTALSGGLYSLRGSLSPSLISGSDFDPQPDPPKPDHWWTAEDRVQDSAGLAHGRELGGVTHAAGLVGQAFQFNGKDSAVHFPPNVGNFGTKDFSVEFLVKSVTRAHAPFLLKRPECNWGNFFEIADSEAALVESLFQKNLVSLSYGRSLNDGDWHHLALTRTGTTVAFYIDGAPVFNQTEKFITAISNAVDLVAGMSPCPTHTGVSPLLGLMDEIKIYEGRVLTAAQIASAARVVQTLRIVRHPTSATFPAPASAHTLSVSAVSTATPPLFGTLTYQWYFNDVAIRGATQSSYTISPVDAHSMGRYRVAVNDGVTTVRSDPAEVEVQSFPLPTPAHWWPLDGDLTDVITGEIGHASNGTYFATGRMGSAFHFRGPNYLHLGSSAGGVGSNDFTVTLWGFVSNTVVSPMFLSWKTNCGAGTFWRVGLEAPDLSMSQPYFHFVGANNGQVEAIPAGAYPTNNVKDGRWHHYAYVRQDTNVTVYLDGVAVARGDSFLLATLPLKGQLIAGIDPCGIRASATGAPVNNNNPLLGLLDDIRIYPTALVRPEVAALMRQAPPVLANPIAAPRLVTEGVGAPSRFKWLIEPAPGQTLTQADADAIDLETSSDLRIWTVIPGAVRLVNGVVEVVDAEAFSKRQSYYRITQRSPGVSSTVGGEIPLTRVADDVIAAAQRHIDAFHAGSDPNDPDVALWADVGFGPKARQLYDPGYHDGAEPAFVELKVVARSGRNEDRGYILLSIEDDVPVVVEFAVEGATKTDRALAEIPGRYPRKFMRFHAGFIAMEDDRGKMLGSWGTLPVVPIGPLPTERHRLAGEYDSESGLRTGIDALQHKPFSIANNYSELRSSFGLNPLRGLARQARSAAVLSRLNLRSPARTTLRLHVNQALDVANDRVFAKVRVDVDDEEPAVAVRLLPQGFSVVGLRPGTELIWAQDVTGAMACYSVVVSGGARRAGLGLQDCYASSTHVWTAGTGWAGDQRQYRQIRSMDWCPVVGCGPTALLMLFGWWDVNQVPSAFYRLREGIGQPDNDFRFAYGGLAAMDAPKAIPRGDITIVNGFPNYIPTAEEEIVAPVAADLFELCNTFCVGGQGATEPADLVNAARTYIDRVVRNLPSPQSEFGEKLVGAQIKHDYTDWYWAGGTDWEGGGLLVAKGIKEGRPGIVGLGDTLFDLHYAVAYAYKRVDVYEGCGSDRELVERWRWFKCNMGWGASHGPEYHDAESVWFGLTMKLWQKKMPEL